MRVDIRLSQADFQYALSQFLPTTIYLDREKTKWLWIGSARHVSVDKEAGVRVAAPLKINWLTTINAELAQISMHPEIAPKGKGFELVFHVALEGASLKGVPALFDSTVVAAVNAALERVHLAWSYTDTLNQTFPMGDIFDSLSGVSIETGPGKHEIVSDTIVLSLQLQVGFARKSPNSETPSTPEKIPLAPSA